MVLCFWWESFSKLEFLYHLLCGGLRYSFLSNNDVNF